MPALPDGWRANSGSRGGHRGAAVPIRPGSRLARCRSTVGYLTPTGMYMALTQSNADEEKLVGSIDPDMVPTGTQDVDGVQVGGLRRRGRTAEPVWTTRLTGPTGPGADRDHGRRRYR